MDFVGALGNLTTSIPFVEVPGFAFKDRVLGFRGLNSFLESHSVTAQIAFLGPEYSTRFDERPSQSS